MEKGKKKIEKRMRGKEQDPFAYSVFFRFFKQSILLRISAKISDSDFYGVRTFVNGICTSVT